jgi:hypothetical protein
MNDTLYKHTSCERPGITRKKTLYTAQTTPQISHIRSKLGRTTAKHSKLVDSRFADSES